MEEKFYRVNGQLKAEINVYVTQESDVAPPISQCRYAILSLKSGHVVYDRLLCQIVNGVFYTTAEDIVQVAQRYNAGLGAPDMAPNGDALGLTYPEKYSSHEEA